MGRAMPHPYACGGCTGCRHQQRAAATSHGSGITVDEVSIFMLLRLGNKFMQLGSGIIWPLCASHALLAAIGVGRVAIVAIAAPLSHLFSAG